MDLLTAAAWASIGQFVVAIVALIVELRRKSGQLGTSPPRRLEIARVVTTVIIGGLTLVVPGWVIYWAAILFATSSSGTPTALVVRSASWATFLAMTWGILWSLFLLPPLVRLIQRRKVGTQ